MNIRNLCLASALACVSGMTSAQGTQTIVLVPEGAELPAAVTRAIDLPRSEDGAYRPAAAAVENSARGLAIANEARENGRAFGEAMAAQARENRENKSRGERPDLPNVPPGQPPGDVQLPTLPEIPAAPERPETPAAPETETPAAPERPEVPAAPPGRP